MRLLRFTAVNNNNNNNNNNNQYLLDTHLLPAITMDSFFPEHPKLCADTLRKLVHGNALQSTTLTLLLTEFPLKNGCKHRTIHNSGLYVKQPSIMSTKSKQNTAHPSRPFAPSSHDMLSDHGLWNTMDNVNGNVYADTPARSKTGINTNKANAIKTGQNIVPLVANAFKK